MIFIGSVVYFLYWLYQPMLKEVNVDIFYFGFVYAFMGIGQIIIMNNYERLEKIFGSKRRLLVFSSIITGVMLIIGGLIKLFPVILLCIVFGCSFGFARRPLFINYMNKFIPSDIRATINSTISMFERCVLAIINPFVGLLIDWSLSYTLIILGSAALIFSILSKIKETDLID